MALTRESGWRSEAVTTKDAGPMDEHWTIIWLLLLLNGWKTAQLEGYGMRAVLKVVINPFIWYTCLSLTGSRLRRPAWVKTQLCQPSLLLGYYWSNSGAVSMIGLLVMLMSCELVAERWV